MAQTNNILVGSPGVASQNSTIMLGNTQTSTYISGIYNQSVGGTNQLVHIDSNGQLGTTTAGGGFSSLNTFPFLAYLVGQTPSITGTGVKYYLGSTIALTEKFDVGGNFNAGTGSGAGKANGAYFLAPSAGVYQFMMNIFVETEDGGIQRYISFRSEIETDTTIYQYRELVPASASPTAAYPKINNNFWFTFQATINLGSGDKVWFNTRNVSDDGSISGKVGYNGTDPGLTTRVSGFKVA